VGSVALKYSHGLEAPFRKREGKKRNKNKEMEATPKAHLPSSDRSPNWNGY